MNLKTSQIIQINQNYGSHRKSEVTDNHGRQKYPSSTFHISDNIHKINFFLQY